MTRYACPDCDAAVWHTCKPPSYFEGRRLPRPSPLPLLTPQERRYAEDREWARGILGEIADRLEEEE